MKDHKMHSGKRHHERLHLIREYSELQQKLVAEAVSRLDPAATEYNFEDSLETNISIDGSTWAAQAHGIGVMFVQEQEKLVVDAHEGFIDAPAAFDAWRLVQYSESKQGTDEDVESWQHTLHELTHEGVLTPHKKHERHYVLRSPPNRDPSTPSCTTSPR